MKKYYLLLNLCLPVLVIAQDKPDKPLPQPQVIKKDSVVVIRLTPLPANFYEQNTGYFCKNEWQLQKKTGVAFKFRLGSVEYCDRLEGKKRF
jgi:hypothetical protein